MFLLHGSGNYTIVLKMTRRIWILHKAECHLIFWNDVDGAKMSRLGQTKEKRAAFADSKGIIVVVFFLLKRCKKQNFLIAPLLGISGSHMYWEVWECQSAHKASLRPRPYGQCEPSLGFTRPLTMLPTLDIATLKISDVLGALKGAQI